jgi:hypothetical protein
MKTKEDILYDLGLGLDPKTDSFILEAMEEYAQEVVKNLNIPAVSVMCECSEKSINHIGPFYKECGKCGKQIK